MNLYIGEIGYGNFGDDFGARLVEKYMGMDPDDMWISSFADRSGEESCEVLLVGGGTLLDFRASGWMQKLWGLAMRAQTTILLGTGLDPGEPWSPEGVRMMKEILKYTKQEHRAIRGPISKAMLELIGGGGCTIVGDPTFLWEPMVTRTKTQKVLIVPGLQAKTTGGEHYHQRFLDACHHLKAGGYELEIMPVWVRDLDVSELYARELNAGHFRPWGQKMSDTAAAFGEYQAVITNRMHAGLAALMNGTPALFMAHHIKVIDMCMALNWPHYCDAGWGDLNAAFVTFLKEPGTPDMRRIAHLRQGLKNLLEGVRRL